MDYESITLQVIDAAIEAGSFIRRERRNFDLKKIEYKGKNDLVSYVDKEAERLLTESLGKILPEAGFIAEEGTGEKNEEGLNWIIDPLDGTTNYAHRLPHYSVSIGLSEQNEIISGVIYDIASDNCYWASKYGKSYCDGNVIRVSEVQEFEKGLFITGYPYRDFSKFRNFYDLMYYFLSNTHGIRRLGSAAIDLAFVASGKSEGFFEFFLNPWDVAAGSLIVRQAGGIVSDFHGGNNFLYGKELIAATPSVHARMQQIILEFWEKQY